MKIRVIDFETTGSDKDKQAGKPAAICEVGFTDLDLETGIGRPVSALVNPGMPIPPITRAIHHISDSMVADAINTMDACRMLMDGMQEGDVFAAHNHSFEKAFFGGGKFAWICSLKCARDILPDAPSHSNQVLRYYLDLDNEFEWPEAAMPPHRAGPDTYVTAHLVRKLLEKRTLQELIHTTSSRVILQTVNFGTAHRGKLWADMDEGFLRWVLEKDFDEDVKNTARHWLNERSRAAKNFVF
ncbi:exonuclease domain-containing protein [Brucella sp. TWI432]